MCVGVLAAYLVQPNDRWINGPIKIIELRYFGYFVALFNHESLNPLPNFSLILIYHAKQFLRNFKLNLVIRGHIVTCDILVLIFHV